MLTEAHRSAEGSESIMEKRFDTKIAVVVREDLAAWQKMNVVAFLAGGLAGSRPEIVGEAYEDASGNRYLPLIGQPIMIYGADAAGMRRAYERARSRDVELAIYTEELFSTGNDEDNRAAVKALPAEGLNLVGIAMRDLGKTVDKTLDGLRLHG
jgi:hypothetical protein